MTDHAPREALDGLPQSARAPIDGKWLVFTAAWMGFLTGLCEVAILAARTAAGASVTTDMLWINRHSGWMIPASDLLLFAAVGALIAFLARLRARIATYWAGPILAAMSVGAILERVPGLHPAARIVLACGLGYRLGRMAMVRRAGFARLVRISVPVLGLVAIVGGPLAYLRVVRFESRVSAGLPMARPGSPNVLLLVLDTVRADHLSLHGYARDTSPNLARLAHDAVRFERARSTAPWTLPSHASMLTGRWPSELSTRVDRPLDATFPTLAEYLGSKGYATAGFVANTYYCNSIYGLDRGFARYEDFPEKDTVSPVEVIRSSALGRRVADVLRLNRRHLPGEKGTRKSAAEINGDFLNWASRQQGRPFFAFLNYYDAHDPYQPPDGAVRRFGMSARPEAERLAILSEYARLTSGKKRDRGVATSDEDVIRQSREVLLDSYDDCIASLDAELGRLFAELDRRGLRDDTIIVLTSDHGEHFGEHDLFGHGVSLYEPEVHVPLLIFAPGVPRGRTMEAPVSLRDIPSTLVDMIGVGTDHPFPGHSLAAHWSGKPVAAVPILAEVEQQKKFAPSPLIPASLGPLKAIVDGSWVYIRGVNGEQLFNLATDPGQNRDLARSPGSAPILRELGAHLDRHDRGEGLNSEPPRMARGAGSKTAVVR
ncbi:MAG: Arylsulfatase [Planctomycetota bacterium]|nr:Arylsulfatase [Planctomycetota bacterium]